MIFILDVSEICLKCNLFICICKTGQEGWGIAIELRLFRIWNVCLNSNSSTDLIIIGNRIACLSYIKSNKKEKCQI